MVKYLGTYVGAEEAIARMCHECGSLSVVKDYAKEELVCCECGLMWSENSVATPTTNREAKLLEDIAFKDVMRIARTKKSKNYVFSMTFDYCGKKYAWTRKARYQGSFDCQCKRCQKYVAGLVEDGDLKIVKVLPTHPSTSQPDRLGKKSKVNEDAAKVSGPSSPTKR